MLAELLADAPVAVREMHPRDAQVERLPHAEAALVAKAIDERKRQFAAGRTVARQALADVGAATPPILWTAERAPLWPEGVVGSITHTKGWAAAAVGRAKDVLGVGLDVEPAAALKPRVFDAIATEDDRQALRLAGLDGERFGKAIFCAKEAAYKAQYALTGTYLGFAAMFVELDPETGCFRAVFRQAAAEAFRPGDVLQGRFQQDERFVRAAVLIPAESAIQRV
ncbi:MAG: 4'-phosphopantetheinyl transferase superfamily protein [Myxococcota bacterium]